MLLRQHMTTSPAAFFPRRTARPSLGSRATARVVSAVQPPPPSPLPPHRTAPCAHRTLIDHSPHRGVVRAGTVSAAWAIVRAAWAMVQAQVGARTAVLAGRRRAVRRRLSRLQQIQRLWPPMRRRILLLRFIQILFVQIMMRCT